MAKIKELSHGTYEFISVPWAVHRHDIGRAMALVKPIPLPWVIPRNDIHGAMAHIKSPAGVENIYCIAVGYEQHQSDWYILVSRFPKIHSIFNS